ncbi:uncharacterized protein LOC144124739 isoform X6 [Amblyomma americanum]
MFAVVRFVHDIDKKLHVIPAKDIANFNPGNNTDFNTRSVYTAFWRDPLDGQDSGHYSAQVLMLGESEKEIRERMAKKRLAMPKIPDYEESSSEEEEETAAQKKKKQKRLMLASKKAEYETILKKNMDNARTKTLAAQSRDTRQAAKKRARASSESASESEDSLCAKSELQEAINQKNFWKKRAKELDEERLFLREQVKSLQRCLESKIFQLDTKLAGAQQADGKSATEFSCTPTLPSSEQATAVCTQPTATPGTSQEQEKAANSSHPAEDTEVAHLPREDFTYLDDGSPRSSTGAYKGAWMLTLW